MLTCKHKPNTTLFIALSIFLASLLIRLLLISKGPYNVDCLNLFIKAETLLDTGKLPYLYGSGYPLTIICAAFFIGIGRIFSVSDPIWAINMMSVVFSAACPVILYYLCTKWFNDITGLFCAALLSVNPIFLSISVYGMNHAISLFFLLTGIIFIQAALESPRRWVIYISAICVGLGGAARLQDMIFLAPALSFWLIFGQSPQAEGQTSLPQRLKITILYWAIAGLVTLSFHMPYLIGDTHIQYIQQWLSFQSDSMVDDIPGYAFDSLNNSARYLFMAFTPLGLLASLGGLIMLAIKQPRLWILLWLWIATPLYFFSQIYTNAPRFHTILLPAMIIPLGYMLAHLTRMHVLIRTLTLIALTLLLSLNVSRVYPALMFRHHNALIVDFARWVGDNTEANARIIVSDEEPFLQYYGNCSFEDRFLKDHTILRDDQLAELKDRLDTRIAEGTPIYITFTGLYSYDFRKKFSSFILNNYSLKIIGTHPYEGWHRGCMKQTLFHNELYQILPRPAR